MSVPVRLLAFAAVLAALLGGGALAGAAIGPEPERDAPAPHAEAGGGHGGGGGAEQHPVRGLAVAERGHRLVVEQTELRRGAPTTLRFRIVDDRGATVRDFDVEHDRRMHLIVARRDLRHFQHLHPRQAADGTWSVPLRLGAAGSYRVFADFTRRGEAFTLAADLRVDGEATLADLPAPRSTGVTDGGLDVRLDAGRAEPAHEAALRFVVSRGGRPVEVEPYLGARGHLVALREGDLAFLHVHPTGEGVRFAATFPTAGRYRLFLQVKVDGRVHTVAFTQEVG